ncbi:AbrB/MazE/SpoVT family DNA-binding domain-containing protein [Serratia marcescens]|nr:AbrB/MazE/SpoVT family DNA-binding domain-containing protein [Serratia marcescens]MBH2865783.1 AbrB/MazE/SpoVT family DNA-binding domain-containing protein [Serratia marcescens]MBW4239717.1 AbrB/MazE/SpoVT family DNA-binding domain-containing protein [Enterobacter roggenkampii]
MRTVSIFKNSNNRAIRLPRDLDFDGDSELRIVREGDCLILRPVRFNWGSFIMREKPEVVLKRLEHAVLRGHRIVTSVVTYAEMRFGVTGPKASPGRRSARTTPRLPGMP